jgi:Na+/H+ antiporter NhaD/arsenite permease-like protein
MTTAIVLTFVLGYIAIAFEHSIRINKAASALVSAVVCWTFYIMLSGDKEAVTHHLSEHLGEISGVLFFLLGAMTIVELIDVHDGFKIITDRIQTQNPVRLLWLVAVITFSLSSILDNLTTTIVMVSMLRKIIGDQQMRLFFAGIVVIAANAGGAWSPMGDVTTTMLWIGGQITALNIMLKVFLPAVICLLVPVLIISRQLKGKIEPPASEEVSSDTSQRQRAAVFSIGLGSLLFVPVFKTITHLPPFMAILLGLGIMWILTELIHRGKNDQDKDFYSVAHALRKIDTPSILFFLGILVSISALESTGILGGLANWLSHSVGNDSVIVTLIGLLSAVVDNVPLVAAAQGMYSLEQYPADHYFWEFLAYATGTGGSVLIIGSAAGVAAMGMEKIDFFWYLKRISWLALVGYFAGCATFLLFS